GGEAVEELLVASRAGHRTPHGFPQFLAGGALAALALGLVALGAGRSLRCGAVPGAELLEPVLGFDQAGFSLGSLGVVVESGAPAVFADERGDDVDVVVGVAHGCPAASRLVGGRSDAGRGDHASGDLPHCSSERTGSSGAARTDRCQTCLAGRRDSASVWTGWSRSCCNCLFVA